MDNEQAMLNLAGDLEKQEADWKALGWQINPWPLTTCAFIVLMTALDGERYALRVQGDQYPAEAPDVIPVDPETGQSGVVTAWPNCEGFRKPNDLCLPYTRTGYALHPDWRKHSAFGWFPDKSTVMLTLDCLYGRLNDPTHYHGRCDQ